MKSKKYFLIILSAIILSAFIPSAGFGAQAQKTSAPDTKEGKDNFYEDIELFTDALTTVRGEYVNEIKFKELIYGALRGMLSSLDPNTQFMDPETYEDMKVDTEGRFGGIGIEITLKDDLLTVISPIDDTPAYKAGLKPQDRIVRIDGVITRDMTLTDAVKKMRGKPGTDLTLTVLRESEHKIFDVILKRDIIKIVSVKDAKILENNIGYVRIVDFQEDTAKALQLALDDMEKKGMDSLILDLRNNPGGLLNIAIDVSDKFLPEGKMIVSVKGRRESQNAEFKAQGKSKFKDYPMVVLVNGGSASGSEIVAGAIKDNARGIILGLRTFGKGSVQTVIPLRDGSALRLTTSKYFTPSGKSVQGEGIMPDVEVEEEHIKPQDKDEKSADEIFDKVEKPEQKTEDAKADIRPNPKLDNQLARAIDIIKGIKVYRLMVSK